MPDNLQFGQYIASEQIGQGGMATVYKAHHARLDRYVAIKVMHNVFLQDETFRTRFEREARIVARLEHPNIVPIYDYSEQDGNPYLVMKCIEGMTLKQRAFKTTLTLNDILLLLTPIADALDYAHRQGVLHRDMKPSNILIDEHGKPYLTDFGLARMAQVGESTISHDMMLGTPFYVSPEQAQGVRDLTAATDIYAFGVILYELVTGAVPFGGDNAYAIVHGHIYSTPTPPSEKNPALPTALDAVLLKVLAKKPTDRYATASDLMADFGRAIGTQPATPVQTRAAAEDARTRIIETSQSDRTPDRERKLKVESSVDLGKIQWNELGERVGQWGERMGEWGERLGNRIEAAVDGDSSAFSRKWKKESSEEEKIRRHIKKQREEYQGLLIHASIYFVINIGMWLGNLSDGDGVPWVLLFMTIPWGIGLISHYYNYRSEYGAGVHKLDEEVARELERRRSRSAEKVKHTLADESLVVDTAEAAGLRLTDDGEFTDSYIEEVQGKRARRS